MDERGFLPPHGCKACGQPLCGPDTGRPAELYAGTYTGLCYPCTNSGPVVLRVLGDGCQVWSHPPHCPSWRRARETFWHYPDCATCRQGMIWVYRPDGQGGSYGRQCEPCMSRYGAHPLRQWYDRRSRQFGRAVNRRLTWMTEHFPEARRREISDIYWPIYKLILNRGMAPMDRIAAANQLY